MKCNHNQCKPQKLSTGLYISDRVLRPWPYGPLYHQGQQQQQQRHRPHIRKTQPMQASETQYRSIHQRPGLATVAIWTVVSSRAATATATASTAHQKNTTNASLRNSVQVYTSATGSCDRDHMDRCIIKGSNSNINCMGITTSNANNSSHNSTIKLPVLACTFLTSIGLNAIEDTGPS